MSKLGRCESRLGPIHLCRIVNIPGYLQFWEYGEASIEWEASCEKIATEWFCIHLWDPAGEYGPRSVQFNIEFLSLTHLIGFIVNSE